MEELAFARVSRLLQRQIVNTEDHILRRYGYRRAIGRFQQVVWRKQHKAAFCLGFHKQWYMHSHLVTIEVGIVSGTYQRMQLDGFTFNQHRFKSLDTQTVQRRRTVQHNRMFFDNIFQYVPDFRLKTFDHLLGRLNIVSQSAGNQFFHYERFKQLNGHFLWQTALINL